MFSALELLIHCDHCYVAYSCLDISLATKVGCREAESSGPRGAEYVGSWEDGPFDPDNGFIAVYLEQMELYFSAKSMPKTKQVPFFLNLIGGDTYELLCNLLAPDKLAEMSLVGLYETLRKHFEPKKMVIAERIHFHRRQQAAGELVANYVAELCKLALHCQFGPYLMEVLTDQLVCGLRSETQQKRLLAEHELTFDRALAIAQSMEAADRDAHTLRGSDTQPGAVCLVPQQHPSQRMPVDSSCVKEC